MGHVRRLSSAIIQLLEKGAIKCTYGKRQILSICPISTLAQVIFIFLRFHCFYVLSKFFQIVVHFLQQKSSFHSIEFIKFLSKLKIILFGILFHLDISNFTSVFTFKNYLVGFSRPEFYLAKIQLRYQKVYEVTSPLKTSSLH